MNSSYARQVIATPVKAWPEARAARCEADAAGLREKIDQPALPQTEGAVVQKPTCLWEFRSIRIFSDQWLGNYFVSDPPTRNFESFDALDDAVEYARNLQERKIETGHPSRFG